MNFEEELQRKVEKGNLHDSEQDDKNVKVYASVFRALQNAPEYSAPINLADIVIQKLEKKPQRASLFLNDYFWFGIGIASLSAAAVFVIWRMSYKIDFGFLNGMSSYKGLVIFGVVFIALLNLIDRRLIRNKRSVI